MFKMVRKVSILKEWQGMKSSPNEGFKEYFEEEKKYLKNNVSKGDFVLDIGCGDGKLLLFLSKITDNVYGLDNDKESISVSKENVKGIKNIKIFLEDAEKTHFNDNFFDKVFIGMTFHNFADLKFEILSEIKRILKIGGELIFSVYNENAFKSRIELYKKILPKKFKIIDEKKGKVIIKNAEISEQFSRRDIKNFLDKAGFKILEILKGKIFYLIKAKKKHV